LSYEIKVVNKNKYLKQKSAHPYVKKQDNGFYFNSLSQKKQGQTINTKACQKQVMHIFLGDKIGKT